MLNLPMEKIIGLIYMRMQSKIIIKVDNKIYISQWCNEYCHVNLERILECPYKVECRRCNYYKKLFFGKMILEYAKNNNWFGNGKYSVEIK